MRSLVARFQTRHAVNVQPGAETAFAMSVIADYRGQKVAFEGVDPVKVAIQEKAADLLNTDA